MLNLDSHDPWDDNEESESELESEYMDPQEDSTSDDGFQNSIKLVQSAPLDVEDNMHENSGGLLGGEVRGQVLGLNSIFREVEEALGEAEAPVTKNRVSSLLHRSSDDRRIALT